MTRDHNEYMDTEKEPYNFRGVPKKDKNYKPKKGGYMDFLINHR